MTDEIKVAKIVDVRNFYCPLPIVKLSSAVKEIAVNDILEVIATDPGVLTDIPHWASSTGNEIVKQSTEGDTFKFFIKRRA